MGNDFGGRNKKFGIYSQFLVNTAQKQFNKTCRKWRWRCVDMSFQVRRLLLFLPFTGLNDFNTFLIIFLFNVINLSYVNFYVSCNEVWNNTKTYNLAEKWSISGFNFSTLLHTRVGWGKGRGMLTQANWEQGDYVKMFSEIGKNFLPPKWFLSCFLISLKTYYSCPMTIFIGHLAQRLLAFLQSVHSKEYFFEVPGTFAWFQLTLNILKPYFQTNFFHFWVFLQAIILYRDIAQKTFDYLSHQRKIIWHHL